MNKVRLHQKGFTLVETFLVLLAVIAIGSVGYYVWHLQQKDETSSAKTATTSETADANKSDTLTITEWDVQLPLGSDLEGATYKASADGESIDITVLESACEPIATVTRDGKTDKMYDDRSSKQVGGYYYSLIQGNGQYCFQGETNKTVTSGDSTVTVGARTDSVRTQIDDAFMSMTAVN